MCRAKHSLFTASLSLQSVMARRDNRGGVCLMGLRTPAASDNLSSGILDIMWDVYIFKLLLVYYITLL